MPAADGSAPHLAARLATRVRTVLDFPRHGIAFRDITPLLADGAAFRDAVEAIASAHENSSVDLVAGVESRGFILAAPVALRLGSGFIPIRKQGRLPASTIATAYALEYGEAVLEVHADALARGRRVLIVDDLLATGGTAAAAIRLVEELGGVVAGLAFLIELGGLNGSAALGGREFSALMTL